MSGFAKALTAALLALTLIAANAAPSRLAPIVNGKPAPELAVMRGDGGRLLVAVQPLAAHLGIPVRHQNGTLALQVDGTWVQLRADDITLHEGDAPLARLTSFPTVRNGRLFIDAADVSTVMDVDAGVQNGRFRVNAGHAKAATADSPSDVNVVEVFSAKPPARVTTPQQPESSAQSRLLANFSASMSDYAQQRNYDAQLDGGGDHFHAMMYVNGMAGSRATVGGTLRVGDAGNNHLSLGGINNPLYGALFTGGGSNGIEGMSAGGTFASYSTTTVDARHVLAFGQRTAEWVREIAFADQFGSFQPMLGIQRRHETPHFVFDRELWVATHGIGAGIQYRTTGRLYTDVRLALAGAGLPLINGDALTQATVGYDVLGTLGVRAGYGIAHGQTAQPLLQIYGGNASVQYSLSHFGIQDLAELDLSRRSDKLRFAFIDSPGYKAFESDGTFDVRRGLVETRAYLASGNSTDILADYRFKQESPSVSLGIEAVRSQSQGRIAPTVGYLFPVGPTLSFGFEYHPLANGNGIRFTARQALYTSIAPRMHSIFLNTNSPLSLPVYLLLDGVRNQRITEQRSRLTIPAGSHYVSIQSEDGRLGSSEERVVDGTPDTVTLSLWPIRNIQGTLRLPQLPLGMAKPSLGGITVMLKPQGITTQTEANGYFSFPPQAIDPDTTVSLDSDSVPQGFAAPSAVQIQTGSLTITLRTSKTIEKVIF